jgi:SAM-dependent methyltransferase
MVETNLQETPKPPLLKLDLGCGKNKREGFLGVDRMDFENVDCVFDLASIHHLPLCEGKQYESECTCGSGPRGIFNRWPWENESAEEIHCSHFVEHLKPPARIHFVNEVFRILIPGGKAQIVVPHWCSNRAYGDLTHEWPPVSEMWFYYLSKAWRAVNAPHNDFYTCDFDFTASYAFRGDLAVRNQEFQQFAMANYKEAAQDIVATLIKPLKPR